jgi:chemotaxis protein MotB
MARKPKHPEHVNHERWLVSYADFITLLFATFTMLFAISNVEKEKLAAASQSLNKAFGGGATVIAPTLVTPRVVAEGSGDAGSELRITIMPGVGTTSGPGPESSKPADDRNPPDNDLLQGTMIFKPGDDGAAPRFNIPNPLQIGGQTDATSAALAAQTPQPPGPVLGNPEGQGDSQMAAKLRELLENFGLKGKVEVREEARGTVISLGEAAFFDSGQVEVKPSSIHQLDSIVNALRDQDFEIRVEGHTDDTPVTSGRYNSNLELSTLRAANIVDFMITQYRFPPQLLSSAGYGEWKPVADNATADGRQKNRRVDIVILNQRMRAQEPQARAALSHPQAPANPASTSAETQRRGPTD